MTLLAVTPKDAWPRPAVKRALDEERPEGVRGPFGGAQLFVEPIHEARRTMSTAARTRG